MSTNLLPVDTFVIINKTILSEESRKILTLLYQPIIGVNSVNLYFTLWAFLDKYNIKSKSMMHSQIVNCMQLSLNEILKARKNLEAVGLVKTYFKTTTVNNYVYELYSPMPYNSFLNHPILNITLYNIVGKKEYDNIVNQFKLTKYDMKDYKDISVSFSDIFKYDSNNNNNNNNIKTDNSNIIKMNVNDLLINNNVDFEFIISSLPKTSINKYTFSDDIKNLIVKLSYVYNLENLQLLEIVRNSMTEKCIIDKIALRKNARNYYQFEHNGGLPNLVNKTQPEKLKSEVSNNDSESKMIYTFDNTKPYDFLKSKQNGALPTSRDLRLLEELAVDYELSPAVINVLIDYVLKVNDNKLTKGFIETIAGEWKRRKIEKSSDAVRIAREEYKKHLKYNKNNKNEKVINEKTPEWFDKTVSKVDANNDEINEMDELLKEFK